MHIFWIQSHIISGAYLDDQLSQVNVELSTLKDTVLKMSSIFWLKKIYKKLLLKCWLH